ncbi:PRC-barrel domain-containing protein [Paracoccus sp. (in: a-proteobacteria)]|uniref:PRC-barrel domain-containing protein n=1 Tax=Paracoccus sp. TaxID=267 RepID=UPI0026DF6B9A|nr:PRC-barrel domain-containing protein [Paracoccus sp. (in: a-proteobacteria)]MDO5646523.1 PRC-barrel domain-containing protein [Paracoccus sp. (in: a-proteobacteria)]
MRKLLLTTIIALPLSMGAALAQDTAAPNAQQAAEAQAAADKAAAEASAATKVEVQQAAGELRIDWITGTTVHAPDGTSIGSINDLIISEDGQMKAAIVGVGGFLGIGQKQIALPWSDLTINFDAREITSTLTKEEADAAPEYVFRDQAQAPAATAGTAPAPAATDMPPAAPVETAPPVEPTPAPLEPAPAPAETAPVDGTTTPAPTN